MTRLPIVPKHFRHHRLRTDLLARQAEILELDRARGGAVALPHRAIGVEVQVVPDRPEIAELNEHAGLIALRNRGQQVGTSHGAVGRPEVVGDTAALSVDAQSVEATAGRRQGPGEKAGQRGDRQGVGAASEPSVLHSPAVEWLSKPMKYSILPTAVSWESPDKIPPATR